MHSLNNDLSSFARAIVRGEVPSPLINNGYANYAVYIAIEVYRNNYRGNLHDTLSGAYPVIRQLVGDDFFRLLARKFIEQHDSHSGNLHHYGAEMAEFVAAFEPAQTLPYLPDVAKLEWECHSAYFTDDAATFNITRLAQVLPEQYSELVLHTHPNCYLLRSRYPVAAIWHAHQPAANKDFHIDLDSGPCNALVSRKDDFVKVSELTDAEADWMQAIQEGMPLGTAMAATQERHANFDLQAALLKLVKLEVFSDFTVGSTS